MTTHKENARKEKAVANVEGAIEDLKAGKVIILVDDDDRENEGDLVLAAEKATKKNLNFVLQNAKGLMCVPCAGEILDRLDINPMVRHSTDKLETPFTVSVDAVKGVSTGMSISDRLKTIKLILSPDTKPTDLSRPGHLFPLRARDEGLLDRQGHTEGSVDLMRLSGLSPVAVICEVMKNDGTMARRDDLEKMAKKWGVRILSMTEIIAYQELKYFKDNYTVIILSASNVPENIVSLKSQTTHAMIPVNGKPAIYWSMQDLIEKGFRKFVIMIGNHGQSLKEFVNATFGNLAEIEFVKVDRDLGPGYSLSLAENYIKTPQILLVLGDTLFEFDDQSRAKLHTEENFVLYKPTKSATRWCLIETNEAGEVNQFIEKPKTYRGETKALIGVYKISDPQLMFRALNAAHKSQNGTGKLEISYGLERFIHLEPIKAFEAKKWYDVGHVDNLLDTRRKMLQTRAYNKITIDDFRGVICKKSKDTKFFDEINYYRKIPQKLQPFFPNIISSRVSSSSGRLEMEYYGYSTLGELFIYGNLETDIWKKILIKLKKTLNYFEEFSKGVLPEKYLKLMYIDKTLREFEALKKQDGEFADLLQQNTIKINGVSYRNFEGLWKSCLSLIKKMIKNSQASFIHGDLFFGNILYDLNSGVIKFVDPRGSFGKKGVVGDIRYDVAKLYHSVDGGYDFIVNNLYQLENKKGKFKLNLLRSKANKDIVGLFDEIFFEKFSKQDILLIEGLMFISMCARHYENKNRQIAFYLTGVRLLNEAIEMAGIKMPKSKRKK